MAESLYKNGLKSKYVHLFMATLHFPKEELSDAYKVGGHFFCIRLLTKPISL